MINTAATDGPPLVIMSLQSAPLCSIGLLGQSQGASNCQGSWVLKNNPVQIVKIRLMRSPCIFTDVRDVMCFQAYISVIIAYTHNL